MSDATEPNLNRHPGDHAGKNISESPRNPEASAIASDTARLSAGHARHRVYVPDLTFHQNDREPIQITGSEARHAAVKRLKVGDAVDLFDGHGCVARAAVERVEKRALFVRLNTVSQEPMPTPAIVIATPVPKGARAETMVEQLSQTAATHWIPLQTERSVSLPRDSRLEKWRTVTAIESAKQSGRAHVLHIHEPTSLATVLAFHDGPILFADPSGIPLRNENVIGNGAVLIVIGPEGGLSPDEITSLREAGAIGFALGPHILRVETAAVVAAAMTHAAMSQEHV